MHRREGHSWDKPTWTWKQKKKFYYYFNSDLLPSESITWEVLLLWGQWIFLVIHFQKSVLGDGAVKSDFFYLKEKESFVIKKSQQMLKVTQISMEIKVLLTLSYDSRWKLCNLCDICMRRNWKPLGNERKSRPRVRCIRCMCKSLR